MTAADNAFLSIFAAGLDFTLPYSYAPSSPNARQSAGFTILDRASNNHGCGSTAATGGLVVESITVTR